MNGRRYRVRLTRRDTVRQAYWHVNPPEARPVDTTRTLRAWNPLGNPTDNDFVVCTPELRAAARRQEARLRASIWDDQTERQVLEHGRAFQADLGFTTAQMRGSRLVYIPVAGRRATSLVAMTFRHDGRRWQLERVSREGAWPWRAGAPEWRFATPIRGTSVPDLG